MPQSGTICQKQTLVLAWQASSAQTARTCIYGHLEECNAQRLSTSSLRRRLRLTLDDPVRPPRAMDPIHRERLDKLRS